MKKYFHIVIAASVLSGITAQGKDFRSEPIPDPKAVKAFQDFWQSFEEYERATMQKAKRQYQVQWDKVKADLQQQVDRNDRVRIEKLKEAEVEYRDHLRKYPDAENRPYVMLNLAQILNMLAESRPRSNDVGNQYRQQALAILKEITTEFPAFDKRAETLYLRAIIFESLNFNRDAQAIWRTLASAENQNIYTVYANLALGDNRH